MAIPVTSLRSPTLPPAVRLGRYELLYSLGSGGMGSVWMARARAARGFEKFFVIKTLLAEHADNSDFREMFFDEARIASSIDHANVAHIFDLGDENGTPYLVMEVVDGESLQRIFRTLKKRNDLIPPEISLRILADVCAGLHAAHELRDATGQSRDVVHRDISPQNILVSMGGVTKVIDFGIAKARDRASAPTTTGALKGKLRYMSPEQASGKLVDRRCDIWAAGAVLYLILSGKPAFDGANDAAILSQLLFGGTHPPLPDSVPRSARDVVDRALCRDLDERFQTADEMRLAIERALKEMGSVVSASDIAAFMETHFHEEAAERRAALTAARATPPAPESAPVRLEDAGADVTMPTKQTPAVDAHATRLDRMVVDPHVGIDPSLVGVGASSLQSASASPSHGLFYGATTVVVLFAAAALVVSQLHSSKPIAVAPVASADIADSAILHPPDPVASASTNIDANASFPGGSSRSATGSHGSTPTNRAPHPSKPAFSGQLHSSPLPVDMGDHVAPLHDPAEGHMDGRH